MSILNHAPVTTIDEMLARRPPAFVILPMRPNARPSSLWSEDRKAVAKNARLDGLTHDEIIALVNKLPGTRVLLRQLVNAITNNKWHAPTTRPVPVVATPRPAPAPKPVLQHALIRPTAIPAVEVDWPTAAHWASHHAKAALEEEGMHAKLRIINAARAGFELPVFRVISTRGRGWDLPHPAFGAGPRNSTSAGGPAAQ